MALQEPLSRLLEAERRLEATKRRVFVDVREAVEGYPDVAARFVRLRRDNPVALKGATLGMTDPEEIRAAVMRLNPSGAPMASARSDSYELSEFSGSTTSSIVGSSREASVTAVGEPSTPSWSSQGDFDDDSEEPDARYWYKSGRATIAVLVPGEQERNGIDAFVSPDDRMMFTMISTASDFKDGKVLWKRVAGRSATELYIDTVWLFAAVVSDIDILFRYSAKAIVLAAASELNKDFASQRDLPLVNIPHLKRVNTALWTGRSEQEEVDNFLWHIESDTADYTRWTDREDIRVIYDTKSLPGGKTLSRRMLVAVPIAVTERILSKLTRGVFATPIDDDDDDEE